jgi:SPP1 gp7 family putative phage head morphogenesis protein
MSVTANRQDPTQTTTLRQRYAQRLRGAFGRLNADIREGVQSRDVLRLNEPPPVFRFDTDAEKAEEFDRWLQQQLQSGVLQVVSRGNNQYIDSAYRRGLEHAESALPDGGAAVDAVFDAPVHRDTAQLLYSRNYSALEGITDEVGKQVSEVMTRGLIEGWSPTKMSSEITDRVDAIGKHRATVLARTEVINAYSEATLQRFEQMGVESVTVEAELKTAGDDRVCVICEALEGTVLPIDEVRDREITVEYDGTSSTVTMKPPIHPQCRCTLIPVIKEETDRGRDRERREDRQREEQQLSQLPTLIITVSAETPRAQLGRIETKLHQSPIVINVVEQPQKLRAYLAPVAQDPVINELVSEIQEFEAVESVSKV